MAAPEAEEALKAGKVTGAGAVKIARSVQKLKAVAQAPQVVSQMIKYKEDKTFYLRDEYWVDSLYEEERPVKEVRFNSEEYFRLLSAKPGLAKYLSVAKKVIVNFEEVNYKIIDTEDTQDLKKDLKK